VVNLINGNGEFEGYNLGEMKKKQRLEKMREIDRFLGEIGV
jgi:hypothetical protein